MMWFRNVTLICITAMILTACGGHRVTYSGYEESTEGVPGFINGKKVSPHVKLGQSYSVDGDTYVPRFQPDYAETGLASWYGPGFHGGKTANGEEFDKHSMTAAHPTLPLPSIVKVTMLSTGKTVIVRINDRGPYAKGRIIDLSYAAAKEIGLIAKGTAKVKVEYMLAESQRFADLLADGRSPDDIDIASEVLPYAREATQIASVPKPRPATPTPSDSKPSLLARMNPIASAYAEEAVTMGDAPSDTIKSNDLSAPAIANTPAAEAPVVTIQPRGDPPIMQATPMIPTPANISAGDVYLQLGSFSIQNNAMHLQQKVATVGEASILSSPVGSVMMYRVRMGPYAQDQATRVVDRLRRIGVHDMVMVRQ